MIGKTLSHYQTTEKLGEGGMGVVYKALDTHLDRHVALKVLPPEKVAAPDRKRRFIQEAKAASALNHPNIITIYDINQADGDDFIAMEYVAGKTLDESADRRKFSTSIGPQPAYNRIAPKRNRPFNSASSRRAACPRSARRFRITGSWRNSAAGAWVSSTKLKTPGSAAPSH